MLRSSNILGAARLEDGMFRRIDHVALHVSDLSRSVDFYERHFGFKKYFQHAATAGMQIAYLRLGDTILELTHRSDGSMSGFHFCLETEKFDEAVQDLQRQGIEMARAPHDTAAREPREKGWRRVVFRGPDGEQIELRG
jgi:lactoylglutathione lyase